MASHSLLNLRSTRPSTSRTASSAHLGTVVGSTASVRSASNPYTPHLFHSDSINNNHHRSSPLSYSPSPSQDLLFNSPSDLIRNPFERPPSRGLSSRPLSPIDQMAGHHSQHSHQRPSLRIQTDIHHTKIHAQRPVAVAHRPSTPSLRPPMRPSHPTGLALGTESTDQAPLPLRPRSKSFGSALLHSGPPHSAPPWLSEFQTQPLPLSTVSSASNSAASSHFSRRPSDSQRSRAESSQKPSTGSSRFRRPPSLDQLQSRHSRALSMRSGVVTLDEELDGLWRGFEAAVAHDVERRVSNEASMMSHQRKFSLTPSLVSSGGHAQKESRFSNSEPQQGLSKRYVIQAYFALNLF